MDAVLIFLNLRRTHLEYLAPIEAAHRLGYGVALIADVVPAGLPTEWVEIVHRVDTYDPAAVDAAVDAVAAVRQVAGIFTWAERDVETVSRVAARLGLPAAPVDAAAATHNKYLGREALRHRPDLTPRFARVRSREEAFGANLGYPAVLKPTTGSGSKGIFVVHDEAELAAAVDELLWFTRPEVDRAFGERPGELVLEELLVGTEHSVEGVVAAGQVSIAGITDKRTSEPFRLETGHLFPTALPPRQQAFVEDLTHAVVKELGLDDCSFHLEAMVNEDGAKLVEIAARPGGDFIAAQLVGLATGRPFCETVIEAGVGLRPRLGSGTPLVAGVRKLMAPRAGVFRGIRGLAAALAVPGVKHLVVERAVGAAVALPPQDYMSSVIGAVIAVGSSHDAVTSALDAAEAAVTVELDAAAEQVA